MVIMGSCSSSFRRSPIGPEPCFWRLLEADRGIPASQALLATFTTRTKERKGARVSSYSSAYACVLIEAATTAPQDENEMTRSLGKSFVCG